MAELGEVLSEDSVRYVAEMTPAIRKTYGLDFGQLLKDPLNYADNPKILEKIKSIEKDVDAFLKAKIDSMGDAKAALAKALSALDEDYRKINQAITTKASIAQVPYIKPLLVDEEAKEVILIQGYSPSIDQFITRMINISDYIADMSTKYDEYMIGSWFFSGRSKYVLSISPPDSEIMTIDRARAEVITLLEQIYLQINAG